MKKTFVIHPFLFAIYPIIFLYAHNIEQLYFSQNLILITLAITTFISLVSWSLLTFILKDKKKAGLIVSLFWLLFFNYGYIRDEIANFRFCVIGASIGPDKVLLSIWSICFLLGTYFCIKTRRNLHNFTNLLNIFGISMVLISLVNIGVFKLKTWTVLYENKNVEQIQNSTLSSAKTDAFPDIYYLIFDEYAGSSILMEIYDYDNSEFIEYLISKGFTVASQSRSNYVTTSLSLASSLNMKYINYLSDIIGIESKDRKIPYQMIKNNKVVRFLKEHGYKIIHLSSGHGVTDHNEYADLDLKDCRGNNFTNMLFQMTMLRPFTSKLIAVNQRNLIMRNFDTLAQLQHRIKEPFFVFAHFMAPHPPYLFGPNGEPIEHNEKEIDSFDKRKHLYLGQLTFINKKIKELLDQILAEVDTLSIIIIQADHGPAYKMGYRSKERFEILNAYFLSGNCKDLLYDSITPVNTFRLIFSCYFSASYDLLDDRSYYSSYQKPYRLIDITDELIGKENNGGHP